MKVKEIKELKGEEREKKLKELKLELIKSRASTSKGGTTRIKQIKKIIARMLTIQNSEKTKELKNK
jgi:ribosomal protein L29